MKFGLLFLLATNLLAQDTFTTKLYREEHSKGLKRTAESKAFVQRALKMQLPAKGLAVSVPGKLDLSPRISPPENQGSCGSCWDFGITKALRSAWMLVGKDPGVLSFNYLLNNCGPGPKEMGCGGGDFDAMQNDICSSGPWLDSQDPYTQSESRCKTGLPVAACAKAAIQVGGEKPSFQLLAMAIAEEHPLVIDVAVCGSWGSYSGGIFNQNSCGASSIDHIINLNGYNCETSVDAQGNCVFDSSGQPVNKDGYLIVMNNWGSSWGENGYMRTRWGMDAVADTAMYFDTGVQPSPTPIPPSPTPVPPAPTPSGIPTWLWGLLAIAGVLIIGFGAVLFENRNNLKGEEK